MYSAVAQTVYPAVYVQKKRQYVEAPCTDAAISTTTPRKYHYTSGPSQAYIWDSGQAYYKPIAMTAGQTIKIVTELDWTRPNIEKNFGVQVWGTKAAVTIKEATTTTSSKPSASWYLYNPVL